MAKSNGKSDMPQGKAERVLSLIESTLKDFKTLTDSMEKVGKTVDNRKKAMSEAAATETKANTEFEKEKNRAKEDMAKIELDFEKARDAFAKGDLQLSMVEKMVQMIIDEYDKLNKMDEEVFLGENASKCRDNIRNKILEMTKELLPSLQ